MRHIGDVDCVDTVRDRREVGTGARRVHPDLGGAHLDRNTTPHLDPATHFSRRHVHDGIAFFPADRCGHGILARELRDERPARIDFRYTRPGAHRPVDRDVSQRTARGAAGRRRELHDVTRADVGRRGFHRNARDRVRQHLQRERLRREAGCRCDRRATGGDGAQPSVAGNRRHALVARRKRQGIGPAVAVARKRCRGHGQPRARDEARGTGIELDPRRWLGHHVDQRRPEDLASLDAADKPYGRHAGVALIATDELAGRIHAPLEPVYKPTDLRTWHDLAGGVERASGEFHFPADRHLTARRLDLDLRDLLR